MNMRRFSRCLSRGALSLAGVLVLQVTAYAGSAEWTASPVRKLARGIANTATGVIELPLVIGNVTLEKGPIAGATYGLLVGVGSAVTRTGVGIIELITFPFPLPKSGYAPLLEPEFLFEPRPLYDTDDSFMDF